MRTRKGTVVLLAGAAVLWIVALASPAFGVTESGQCTGTGAFSNGTIVSSEQPIDVISVVPAEGSVEYGGSTGMPKPENAVPFNGSVDVALPFGGITIVTWSGETELNEAAGTYEYEVPAMVPRGSGALQVTARHVQEGQTCVATVQMAIEGSPGAAAAVGAVGTVIFGAGVVGAGFKKKGLA